MKIRKYPLISNDQIIKGLIAHSNGIIIAKGLELEEEETLQVKI